MSVKKDWWTPLRVGLFTDKNHRERMGQAIWLYGYLHLYADRQTGRLARSCGTVAAEIGAKTKTVQRWMRLLEKEKYIQLRRLPHGFSIQIEKYRPIGKEKRQDKNVQSQEESSDILETVIGHFGDSDRTFDDSSDKNVAHETTTELRPKSIRPDKNEGLKERFKESNKKDCLTFSFPADKSAAQKIYQMLLAINPKHKKPNFLRWENDIRLIQTQDGRTLEEILDLFTYANNHDFWRSNILSPAKLRKQWDQLTIQKNSNVHGNGFRSQADINSASSGRVVT